MNDELEGSSYPSICLKGLRKTMKNLSQDSQFWDKILNHDIPSMKQKC
jgi:hypothetical protein